MADQIDAPVEPTPSPVDQESEPKKDMVSYETHRKLLAEKKKQDQLLEEFRANQKKTEELKLIEEGKLKEALELKEKELAEKHRLLQEYDSRDKTAKKISCVLRGLGTKDLDDKWFTVIHGELDEIKFDDSGEIDQSSVLKVVETLKTTWPEMLATKRPGMPGGVPSVGTPGTISYSEWQKLSAVEMSKWKPHQIID